MPLLFALAPGFAQIGNHFSLGESVQFDIKPVLGNTYCWKVVESADQKNGVLSDPVTFLSTTNSSSILLKWEKPGTYLLSVTALNQDGCSNMKTFQVIVSNLHIPVAIDDYISTNWLKNIGINVLSNDHDSGNDLDTLSLKVLSKPEYGEISVEADGRIIYEPNQNHAVKDWFYYLICDRNNQCDTAKVTIEINNPPLYLPEAISPNGDGKNDRFVILGLTNYPKSSLTILTREGIIIYQTQDYQNDWAGQQNNHSYSGLQAPTGTYYYVFRPGGTKRIIKGFIYIAE